MNPSNNHTKIVIVVHLLMSGFSILVTVCLICDHQMLLYGMANKDHGLCSHESLNGFRICYGTLVQVSPFIHREEYPWHLLKSRDNTVSVIIYYYYY